MIQLVSIEITKMLRRRMTLFIVAFILLLIGGNAFYQYKYQVSTLATWKADLKAKIASNENNSNQLKQGLTNPKSVESGSVEPKSTEDKMTSDMIKDISDENQKYSYAIHKNIPINIMTPIRFVSSSEIIFFFWALISLFWASSIMSSEFTYGTIKTILVRPVSRWKFIIAKNLAMILTSFSALVLITGITYLVGYVIWRNSLPYYIDVLLLSLIHI